MEYPKTVETLNPKEKEALKEFRRQLHDVNITDFTDAFCLKYLRAKNFNIKKATVAFRTYTNFLLAFDMENIEKVWEKPEVVEKYEFIGDLGFAKDGTPIRFVAMGRCDYIGFKQSIDAIEIGRYAAAVIEKDIKRGKEQGKKLGKEINTITYVMDMEFLSLRQVFSTGVLELGMDLLRLFQDYYPEIWERVLIVNAPSFFSVPFNLVKHIFKKTLMSNMEVVSKDGTAQLLLKYVDEDVLPAFLGGKHVDSKGNPACLEFIKFGGQIPEKYYVRNWLRPLDPTEPDVTDIWLSPRCCYNASFVVREEKSVLHIECRTEGGSILTGILYRKFGPDPEKPNLPSTNEYLDEHNEKCNVQVISPFLHTQSHIAPTKNFFIAPFPGIYIIAFDNTYNWLTSRRIILKVQVTPPDSF